MKYRFFAIPAREPAAETEALNRLLAEGRILAVDRHFVADGLNSFWAISVSYQDALGSADPGSFSNQGRKPKIDYREVFDERDFAVFAALRTLRKDLAEREGVPAYALFTNEQLAAMVRGKSRSAADLAAIEGVGKARVEKYATAFLRVLTEQGWAVAAGEEAHAADTD